MKGFFLCIAVLGIGYFSACDKDFSHSAAIEKSLEGTWQSIAILESNIGTDPQRRTVPSGSIRSQLKNTFRFFSDGTAELIAEQEFVNYTPFNDAGEIVTDDDAREYITQNRRTVGTYQANARIIKYTPHTISVQNENEMPYVDYKAQFTDPEQLPDSYQFKYRMKDGHLIVTLADGTDLTYERVD